MKLAFSVFIFLLGGMHSVAQSKRGNVWVTGTSGNTIDFNAQNIISKTGIYFPFKYFDSGSSSICDTNGNLILASDGMNIYDSYGNYIQEGDTIVPPYHYSQKNGFSLYSQSSLFLPFDSNKFYFVTPAFSDSKYQGCQSGGSCFFDLLLYNVVDMRANGGAGQVVKRMVPLLQNAQLRKTQMQACRHGNGKDWWLLKNVGDSANIHVFLFTQDTVYDKGVQVFSQPVWGEWDIRGQSTFSSDGHLFASTSHGSSSGLIFIAEFDRCHGLLSNPYTIQMPVGSQHIPNDTTVTECLSVGLCFSPNQQFLYVVSMSNIYQYDLSDSSWYHVAGLDTSYTHFTKYETAYLASDHKIYIGNFGGTSKQMSRIDNPDVKASGCNFCPRCLRLDSLGLYGYAFTPPCMPDYNLGAKTCWPLSLSESEAQSAEWVVYPNPTSGKLYIRYRTAWRVAVLKQLYNSIGQLMLQTKENELDVSHLPKGVYYLHCVNAVRKVVVD